MSVEKVAYVNNFEQLVPREIERKFMPLFPEQLSQYREQAQPIEQLYLSHPSEPFSLRLRESVKNGALIYEATLKDTGIIGANGIDRMEITAPISTDVYELYRSPEAPLLRKLRAEPLPGVTIDYYENGDIQVESENELSWQAFVERHGDMFIDTTRELQSSNEWRAHVEFRRDNGGHEALVPQPEINVTDIVRDVQRNLLTNGRTIVHIAGRSGSGKSTIVSELQKQLEQVGYSSCVVSTDDYHRGNTWLVDHNNGEPWTRWDDAVVYDTATMSIDIEALKRGEVINERKIDWTTVEPHYPGLITPADVIIIEGIYAHSPDITAANDLTYELPTPLATCVGRRLLRDLKERPEFADPVKSLAYMLSNAEPCYRAQAKSHA